MSRRVAIKKQAFIKKRVENIQEERDSVFDETYYLLSTPANRERLLRSLKQARSCQVFAKELAE